LKIAKLNLRPFVKELTKVKKNYKIWKTNYNVVWCMIKKGKEREISEILRVINKI